MKHQFVRYLLVLLTLLYSFSLHAQETTDSLSSSKERILTVYCPVLDHITHDPLSADTLRGELINAADSSFIDTLKIGKIWTLTFASADVTRPGKYFMRLFYAGYEPKYVPFTIKKLYKNEFRHELKTAYMRRQKKFEDMELDEVVVKATKLKFYMDGDTLVYDADAFSMAEGSMLGQLIQKLPGVELDKGGEIKVNGKKVDAMLLNGKDFFDSDRELLLNNMPSYMVKNVQSYERVPENVKGTNKEKTVQKELVMNVKLKKEYNAGWLATITGGAGSTFFKNVEGKLDTKFLGRLFATRFDDRSRLVIYAATNNLNDSQTPGEGGYQQALAQSTGITTTYNAGTNYYRDFNDYTRYQAAIDGSYSESTDEQHRSEETFLLGGNTYGRSFSRSLSNSFVINTNHSFSLYKTTSDNSLYKSLALRIEPSFSYSKNNGTGESASLTLAQDVANDLGKAWLDSIMAPDAGELIRKFGINRSINSSKNNAHNTGANVMGSFNYTPAHNDVLDISARFNYTYTDNTSDGFSHELVEYPNNPSVGSDFRNKYTPNYSRSNSFNITPNVSFMFDREWGNNLGIEYSYNYNNNRSNQSLYLLNKLDGWKQNTLHPIGTLPSMDDMLKTIDADNSSLSETTNNQHTININFGHSFTPGESECFSQLFAVLSLPITNEKLDYHRGTQVDTLLTRNTIFFSPSIMYIYNDHKRFRGLNVSYGMTTTAPSIMSMIPFVDTSNPLMETHTNPNLKNTLAHNFTISYHDKYGRILFNTDLNTNIIRNQVASGFIFNKDTGKRVVTPENVNGNWDIHTNIGIDSPFDKDEKVRLDENIKYSFNNSVDLSGTTTNQSTAEAKATRSVVGSHNISNALRLNWRPSDKMEYSLNTNFSYQCSNSQRMDFTQLNLFDFNYGATAKVELPLGFQAATDVTMYSRRGYSDESMNTNEFVWNLRLTKKFLKGNLLLQADGFDILGNLSNIRKTINAQGRTEVFSNVIPSYFLLHLTYRFNKYPKNKKAQNNFVN